MEEIDSLEICYLLTDYGTIIPKKLGNSDEENRIFKEYSIDYFEKFCIKSVQPRVKNFQFIKDDVYGNLPYFCIYLDDERKVNLFLSSNRVEKLKQGIIDSDLDRLINLSKIKNMEYQQLEINRNFQKTGQFPNNVTDINLYEKFLCEKKSKGVFNIIKSFATVCAFSGGLIGTSINQSYLNKDVVFVSALVCMVGGMFSFLSFIGELRSDTINDIKYYPKKIKALSKHREELEKDEIHKDYLRYRDEVKRVGTLIQKLSAGEQDVYREILYNSVVGYASHLEDRLYNYKSSFYSQLRDWNKKEYRRMFLLGIEVQRRLEETDSDDKKISCSLDEIVPESGITYLKTI